MKYKEKSSIVGANILFLLVVLLFISAGSIAQSKNLIIGLLITEYIIVLMPNLAYLKVKNLSFKKSLRLNTIKFTDAVRIILITIFSYPIAVFFQVIFIGILNSFIDLAPNSVPIPTNSSQFIIGFLVMAITPGICEEIMFRGVLLNEYKSMGPRRSILLTSFLFAIMHMTISNFIGIFFLGIIFGVMVYKTNSIYSSVIGHITNNSIALSLGYFLTDLNLETIGLEKIAIYYSILLIVSPLIVMELLKNLGNKETVLMQEDQEGYKLDKYNIWIYSPVLVVLIIYIYVNTNYVLG